MKVMVLHGRSGRIISVARVYREVEGSELEFDAAFTAGPYQSVLALDLDGELAKKSLREICNECSVDLKSRKLVKRRST